MSTEVSPPDPRSSRGPSLRGGLFRSCGALFVPCIAVFLLLLGATVGVGQEARATVVGVVTDRAGNPLRSVSITRVGTSLGTFSGASGAFVLRGVPPGDVVLRATTQGFRRSEVSVRVEAGVTTEVVFVLAPDPIGLDAVMVTGTMRRTTVSASPVKVEIVPITVLQRSSTNNLTEALQYVNGLYNQVDCGVCYTNNIRINGMEGPNTAVLIDGMPILSSLASVYGLN
ncbi:MAG: carboxypeptidase-like regulatory domain-containing protein, partial [Phycisphaeraceae bacterium]